MQEARSPATGARVALKRLRVDGPHDTAHLKREFRTLADVVHPNLVRLHELTDDGDDIVLAMDLVDGHTFLEWVWGRPRGRVDDTEGFTWSSGGSHHHGAQAPITERPHLTEALIARLRQGLQGLATGLSALHAAHLLHRDIKPGNVMVDSAGRVRVVDFGLAMRPGAVETIAGTVAYMAPEQIGGGALTAASDWYGVGSLLFEALTGRTPFIGPAARMLFDKQLGAAPRVDTLAPDAPADLVALCEALLQSAPASRPSGAEICQRLGAVATHDDRPVPFVGRHEELAELTTALHGHGRRIVHVCAPSGMGKSRLVEHFVAEVCTLPLVLSGRCYEREHTTFKALDPLIAQLASWLEAREPLADDLGDWGPMARLFPPLARAAPRRIRGATLDPVAERQQATEQLARLLGAVARRRPLVLWVDDLQWADRDSVLLLRELLGSPSLPPLLCIVGWRSDHLGATELLAPLSDLPSTTIQLPPLSGDDALDLLRAEGADEARAARIAAESAGSPFFLREMARHQGQVTDLRAVLRQRVDQLDAGPRQLLHAVAVAARPLAPAVALRAAPDAAAGDLVTLTVGRLLTTRRQQALECTHDQIREAVVRSLSGAELTVRHRSLAEALGPHGDPEVLAEHWIAAGDAERAAPLTIEAARNAEQSMAFEKAVALYRRARALGAPFDADLQIRLGRALGRAGYAEGADELLGAAQRVPSATQARDLEREALHQLLRAGRIEEAGPWLPRVVRHVGLPWPRTTVGTYADILWTTAKLRTGLVRPRGATPHDERALGVALELSMSLSFVDMVRTAMLTGRAIELAERIGAPTTRALAAAMRGSNATLLGDLDEGTQQLDRATDLLPADATELDRAAVELHQGIAAAARCHFPRAVEILDQAAVVFERHGKPYEAGMAQTFRSFALIQLGDFPRARQLRDRMIRQARQRGDKHLEMFFRVSYSLPPGLMDDDPAATEAQLDEVTGRWGEGVSTIWLYTQVARGKVLTYRGRTAEARAHMAAAARSARGGALLSVPLNGVGLWTTWAAAAAPDARHDATARREVETCVRQLRSLRSPYGPTFAAVWEASLGGSAAPDHLAHAAERLEQMHTPWLLDVVRVQHRRLLGQPPGDALTRLHALGLVAPLRVCDLLAYVPA